MTTILVIEDENTLRDGITEILIFEGYTVMSSEDGIKGIALAQQQNPDLIICDVLMPEIDGFGVLETLRSDKRTAGVPFIFLSAKVDKVDVAHGLALGATYYLTKPFTVQDLLNTIRNTLKI